MSGNIRKVSLVSSLVLGSWFAVRAIAASPEPVLDDPPLSMTTSSRSELRDDGLAEAIHRFATLAPAAAPAGAPLASR
jgi:hypothetical protein